MQEPENKTLDDDIALAQKILSCRPTSSAVVIPKGGIKFSSNRGTTDEQERLQSYYNARKKVLSSLKVRKLANLGLAEWLPEYSVARIVRHGKFLQVQGFLHEKDFLALYAEEALFLLDIGDIELIYKGASLSMQDAFCLLLTSEAKSEKCSFDQYCVYAHLCRMGFRVQRFQKLLVKLDDSSDKRERNDSDEKKKSKKMKYSNNNNNDFSSNLIIGNSSLAASSCNQIENIDNLNEINNNKQTLKQEQLKSKPFRGWWFNVEDKKNISCNLAFKSPNNQKLSSIKLPNLAQPNQSSDLILNELPESLIPPQTSSWKYEIENIWYERLRKDDRASLKTNLVYSHPNKLDYNYLCRQATSWSHFKSLVEAAVFEKRNKIDCLCNMMCSREIKPLVNPRTVNTRKIIHNQLNVFNKIDVAHDRPCSDSYKLHYNVYQTTPDKPFKKTNPGRPFVRICVVNSADPVPSLADTKALNSRSDGVPVKIALVNCGKIMFFGFDDISIPIDLVAES